MTHIWFLNGKPFPAPKYELLLAGLHAYDYDEDSKQVVIIEMVVC